MPGSVANAAPATVFPQIFYTAFRQARAYPVLENQYRNGESQRSRDAATSRKQFVLTARLSPTDVLAVRDFFEARKGAYEAFYYYYPWETSPKFSYDPTGVATAGRYTVRLDSHWEQIVGMGSVVCQVALMELA